LVAIISNMPQKPQYSTITEHWFAENELPCINIEDYKRISAYARKNTLHGGSAIFVDKRIDHIMKLSEIVEI
ncbi:hypothetical protein HHI36_016190, partial [Cryptolaemus montrouzieri]